MDNKDRFLETDKERALKIKEYLDVEQIKYTTSNIHELVHFDVENITDEQAKNIKKYYEQLSPNPIEKRHRKWDEKYHTLSEEIKGEITGANREEEVEYGI